MGSGISTVVLAAAAALTLVHLLCFCCCCPSSSSKILPTNETDRLALLEFKSMISTDPLGTLNSWNDSTHFCQWYGVSCSRRHHGRVTVLHLPSQGLSGSISPPVGNLSFLKVLSLYNNSFIGEIPPQVGRLGRLQRLVLHNNSLGGAIPSNISGCLHLTTINVQYNKLAGVLPWSFGQLNKLQGFYVSVNNLTGSIPPSFGNLSSLQELQLDQNQLSGRVPNALGQLKSLRALVLESNNLIGKIPHSTVLNLSSLTEIYLGMNQFHGNLPWDIGTSLPNLESFNVEGNQLNGSIPPSLSNASNLIQLQLHENSFTGSMPSMPCSNKLLFYAIHINYLGRGEIDDLSFLSSLTNSTHLQLLAIAYNNFGGSVPQQIGNLSTNLWALTFSFNKISGSIPAGIQYLVKVQHLSAHDNNLSGTIPFGIGNLNSLYKLRLFNNNFSGPIPWSIGNLTKLIELYLDTNRLHGEIPASIKNCQNLLLLDVSSNNLSGVIAPQLMSLTSLSIGLDLSENQFIGALPDQVGNLKNLAILDLSHNMLSGSIPTSLGSCVSLEKLYLQGNLLQGPIPSSLSSLRGIQQLDLSSNNLSGQIPKFLERMNISQVLNLSYNGFDGEVPEQGVFKNSSIISITGNSKLCGGIAQLKLPPCNFFKHSKKNDALSHKWKWIVISIISGMLSCTCMASCLFIRRIKKRGKQDAVLANDRHLPQLSYQALYNSTNGFSSENLIGVGSSGSVYKGVLDDNETPVAVKVFNLHRRGASKSFVAECEALKNIRHRNLVRIVTVCSGFDYQGNDFKALVYEFLGNRSLEHWLLPAERMEEPPLSPFNLVQRVNVALDIASAIDYLHNQCETPIVHCDLKLSNVLLDADMVGHVGDFGLARFLSTVENPSSIAQPSSSIGIKGTVGYAPPEYGMGNEVSVLGDMYSYGILLLEMFTGKRPTDETFREGINIRNFVKSAITNQQTVEVVDSVLLGELLGRRTTHRDYAGYSSDETKMSIYELLTYILEIGVGCSSDIPEERISISEVLSRLTAIKKSCLVQRM